MKKRLYAIVAGLLIALIILPVFVSAWSRGTHDYLCPEDYQIDCKIADSFEFQKNNPYANPIYHVCYDDKEDCMPRLVAKYFLKKYYNERQTENELIGAATHLLQDASCPAHWYPRFNILGKETGVFAPSWVIDIEWKVNSKIENKEDNWNIPIEFRGNIINVNKIYLDLLKAEITETISKEPEENLKEIEAKIKSERIWNYLRGYRDFTIILIILLIPLLGYEVWKWKKDKKISLDLIVTIVATTISALLLLLIKMFY